MFGPFDSNAAWIDTNDVSNMSMNTAPPAWDSDSAMTTSPSIESPYATTMRFDESMFGTDFDWANTGGDLQQYNAQLATPAHSASHHPMDAFSRHPSVSMDQHAPLAMSSLSPGAQADQMLFTPCSNKENEFMSDEGYGEVTLDIHKPAFDFSLFDNSHNENGTQFGTQEMFPELGAMHHNWAGRSDTDMQMEE